jgi:nitrogen regulatory protein P-II 1
MKKIEVVCPLGRLEKVIVGMEKEGIGGLTYIETKGRGQVARPQITSSRGTSSFVPAFNANSTIILVVKDSVLDKIVNRLLELTSTGMAGEGKIFVSDVDEAIDIGSKTRGEPAI